MMFHPGADIIKGILLPVRKRELFFLQRFWIEDLLTGVFLRIKM